MFEMSKIQIDEKDPEIVALMGMQVYGMAPWENNHRFTEIAVKFDATEIRYKQLEQLHKLFKPHNIIIHLEPQQGIFKGCNVSILFEKNNVPKVFCDFYDYVQPVMDVETSFE